MTSPYNIVYPPKGRQIFDGGKNSKYQVELISPNESPDCLNVAFNSGTIQTRGGTLKYTTATAGSFACDGFYTRFDSTTQAETMVVFGGNQGFIVSGTSFNSIPSANSVFSTGIRVGGAQYENYLFVGNGSSIPYKYNGAFTRHGIYPPASAPAAASAASAGLTSGADYQYKVTFVNSALVESDVSPATSTFTVSSSGGSIDLASIPVAAASWGVSSRYIYRTSGTTGGGAIGSYYRIATLADNSTTTYSDRTADASIGTTTAPTDQGVPPNYQCIVFHQARLFVVDPTSNLVKYSELGNPYVFKSTSFRRIGDNTFDVPTGLDVYNDSVVVRCRDSVWIIYMPSTDPTDWVDIRVRCAYGSNSPFGAYLYDNQLMFPATYKGNFLGYAAISGESIATSATLLTASAIGSDMQSDRIEPDMFSVQDGYVKNISSIVHKNTAYSAVTYGTSNTTNNRIYYFDFTIENLATKQQAAWSPWTGVNPAQFAVYGGNLYFANSDSDGLYVRRMNLDTLTDDGTGIDSYFWTKEFYGLDGDENVTKDFRYANILYETYSGTLYLSYRTDSDSSSGNVVQIDTSTTAGSVYGSGVYGVSIYGAGEDQLEQRIYLGTSRGKRIQFKFSNNSNASFKVEVVGLNFVYNRKGRR